jgi:predicted nuclease with TOPRIM domain
VSIITFLRNLFLRRPRSRSPAIETHADVIQAVHELLDAVEAMSFRLKDLETEQVRIEDALLPLEEARHQHDDDIKELRKDLNKIERDLCPEQTISDINYLPPDQKHALLAAQMDYIEVPTGQEDYFGMPITRKVPRPRR